MTDVATVNRLEVVIIMMLFLRCRRRDDDGLGNVYCSFFIILRSRLLFFSSTYDDDTRFFFYIIITLACWSTDIFRQKTEDCAYANFEGMVEVGMCGMWKSSVEVEEEAQ